MSSEKIHDRNFQVVGVVEVSSFILSALCRVRLFINRGTLAVNRVLPTAVGKLFILTFCFFSVKFVNFLKIQKYGCCIRRIQFRNSCYSARSFKCWRRMYFERSKLYCQMVFKFIPIFIMFTMWTLSPIVLLSFYAGLLNWILPYHKNWIQMLLTVLNTNSPKEKEGLDIF